MSLSGPGHEEFRLRPDVLIVDDDEDIRLSFADILQGAGYTVATAEDVDSALRVLRERGAGVVLLDLRLPRQDGISLLDAIDAPVPVIVVSGRPFNDNEVDRARSRVVVRLQKPVQPRRLLQVVGGHLRPDGPPSPG